MTEAQTLVRLLESLEVVLGEMSVRVTRLDFHTVDLAKALQRVDKKVHRLELSDGCNEAEKRFRQYELALARDGFSSLKQSSEEVKQKNALGARALKQLLRRELVSCFERWAIYVKDIRNAMIAAGQTEDDNDSITDGKERLGRGTGVERMRERIQITSTEKNELTFMAICANMTSANGRNMLLSLFLRNVAGISRSEPQKGIDGSRLIHPSSPLFIFWESVTGVTLIITAYLVPMHLSIWNDDRLVLEGHLPSICVRPANDVRVFDPGSTAKHRRSFPSK